MAEAKNKTKAHDGDVLAYLAQVEPVRRREDAHVVLDMMQEITGEPPKMWGPTMIGFGEYRFKYESGREGDWFLSGFAPRKANLVLYIMGGFQGHEDLMAKLGKHKTGKSCLYVNKLEDIDLKVLRQLIQKSAAHVKRTQSGC
jgi:hypothetical protein